MTRPLCLLGLAFALASCEHLAVPTTLSQNVPTAVATSCLKPGQRPKLPTRITQDRPVPPDSLTEMVGLFRAKLKEWQDVYGPTADDLLKACEQAPPPPAGQEK